MSVLRRYPRNTPGVLPDDKRTLFGLVPLLRCNNEAMYTSVRVETPPATNGSLLFVPKMQIATPIAAVVPTPLELINSPVLVPHLVQTPPLIRVNCAINALIARAFDDCCWSQPIERATAPSLRNES